jgi:hypothetical protein
MFISYARPLKVSIVLLLFYDVVVDCLIVALGVLALRHVVRVMGLNPALAYSIIVTASFVLSVLFVYFGIGQAIR